MASVNRYPESQPFCERNKSEKMSEQQISCSAKTFDIFQYSGERDFDPNQVECFLKSLNRAEKRIEVEKGNKLFCQICKLSFEGSISRHKLLEHVNLTHNLHIYNKGEPCLICKKVFYTLKALKMHKNNCERDSENPVSITSELSDNRDEFRRRKQRNDENNTENRECNTSSSSEDDIEPSEGAMELKSDDLMIEKGSDVPKNALNHLFKCYICSEVFTNPKDFSSHMIIVHKNESDDKDFGDLSYRCKKCATTFPNIILLREHFFKKHTALIVYRCTVCHVNLKNKKSLKIHHKNFHSHKTKAIAHSCDECGRELKNLKALKAHIRLKHDKNINKQRFQCRLCKEKFDTKEKRKLHYEEEHLGESPFICTDCGKGFSSKSGLYGHRQLHKTDQPSTCPYCEKIFNRKDSYHEHILIHIGPRHRCPHCPKEFVQRSNLIRHIRIHTGQKPYTCTFCDKRFSDKGACNSHIRVHTKEEQCTCQYCGQTFTKKQKLKYHIRKHTGEGLISCEICSKTFTNGFALKEHRAIHDKQTQTICVECGKAFNSEKYLQRHISLVHQDPDDSNIILHCPICEKIFFHQTRLKSHLLTHLGKKHLQCLICEKRYSSPKSIRNHLKRTHDLTPDQAEFKKSLNSAFENTKISLNSIRLKKDSQSVEISSKDRVVTFLFKEEKTLSDDSRPAQKSVESITNSEKDNETKLKSEICEKESIQHSFGDKESVSDNKDHRNIEIKKEICYENIEEVTSNDGNINGDHFSYIKTEDTMIYDQNWKTKCEQSFDLATADETEKISNDKNRCIPNKPHEETADNNFEPRSLNIEEKTMIIDKVWSLNEQSSPIRQLETNLSAIIKDSIHVNEDVNGCESRNNSAKDIVENSKDVEVGLRLLEKESSILSLVESSKEINRRRKQLKTPKKYIVSPIESLTTVDNNKFENIIIPKRKRVEAIARSLKKFNNFE